jgi:endo-cleaving rubber dioxygenase
MNHGPGLRYLAFAAALLLCACAGEYGGDGGAAAPGSGGNASARSAEELFTTQVQPRLAFCRTCHIPDGVADVDDGREFMLGAPADDLANLRASWERLGGNGTDGRGTSRILLMASGQEPHSGGAPWPQGSDAYRAMDALLKCFGEPGRCSEFLGGTGGGPVAQERALLGSRHGGHRWFDFCEGHDDDALLPPDPRALVQPGVSEGRAVHFNAWWKDCHVDPQLVGEQAQPQTCGELRASWARGERLMRGNGGEGAGTFFAGDQHQNQPLQFSAEAYNRVWQLWGLAERPDNFDELLAERYGMPIAPVRNPYPLPGEDPQLSDGGSGQLPAFMTQLRGPNGEWTGRLGYTCHACHSSAAGLPQEGGGFHYGLGNNLHDIALMSRELGQSALSPGAIFTLFGTSRGTNNASAVNVFFLSNQQSGLRLDQYTLDMLLSGSTASGDTPSWWNMGSRPLKFQDGYFAADASRVDLIFYTPFDGVLGGTDGENWVRAHAQDADKWIMALKSPAYPLAVDTALAEQGAVLFHAKDLWAPNLSNPVPRPQGGNGSCASCHGAYSPRYVHDPAYLADPALEGVASNIAAHEVIRTDRRRADTNNEAVNQYGTTSFLGYPETVGTDQDCGPQNRAALRGERPLGYLAPPLYGVWASAPYLHNGAVPDVWSLLKPEDRPQIWRRVSTPARADQAGQAVMGYDVSLARAYDEERMGWKYDALACGTGTLPFLDCAPGSDDTSPVQAVLHALYGNVLAAWNLGNLPVFLQVTRQQVEDRKIYNTHLYSQGNQGHDFTGVLTDAERRAIIEYLKTL